MQITDKCQLDELALLLWLHFPVLLVHKVIPQCFLWFALQQVIDPRVKIDFFVLVEVAYLQNEGAEDLVVENLVLEHGQDGLGPLIGDDSGTGLGLVPEESDEQVAGHVPQNHEINVILLHPGLQVESGTLTCHTLHFLQSLK